MEEVVRAAWPGRGVVVLDEVPRELSCDNHDYGDPLHPCRRRMRALSRMTYQDEQEQDMIEGSASSGGHLDLSRRSGAISWPTIVDPKPTCCVGLFMSIGALLERFDSGKFCQDEER